jgi:hypothetical protein
MGVLLQALSFALDLRPLVDGYGRWRGREAPCSWSINTWGLSGTNRAPAPCSGKPSPRPRAAREFESLLALSASLRRIARRPHRPRGPCRESRVSVCDSPSTSGRRDRQVGRGMEHHGVDVRTTLGESGIFAAIFAANVWTAILPSLIRNVSVPNTMSADAQFACHTM